MERLNDHPRGSPSCPALTINCPDCRGLGVISCEACTTWDSAPPPGRQRIVIEHCPDEEKHVEDARMVVCPTCGGSGGIAEGRRRHA